MKVNLFILDRFPQTFDKDVVPPAAFAIHADLDTVLMKGDDEGRAGELAILVGIHDLGFAVFRYGFFQDFDTGTSLPRQRQA